jgi:hypothetical protein
MAGMHRELPEAADPAAAPDTENFWERAWQTKSMNELRTGA